MLCDNGQIVADRKLAQVRLTVQIPWLDVKIIINDDYYNNNDNNN